MIWGERRTGTVIFTDPFHAERQSQNLTLAEEYRRKVRSAFPLMCEADVETVMLGVLYGHMTPGQA